MSLIRTSTIMTTTTATTKITIKLDFLKQINV